MPPPDLSSTYLAQQQQLLREIRDELRSSRSSGGGAGGGSNFLGSPSQNAPWIHTQMSADKLLSGEWNTLGWSTAYSSHYKSTLSGDILGAFGLRPAPATMHQVEFERMAAESLATRAGSLPFDILSGGMTHGFNARSREMGSDLLAYSSRFMRAGDAGVGPMGNGMGMSEANRLARGLQAGAINDLRMSGRDYNEVLRGGLQSGQFDFVKNVDELKQKFSELKESVADVTRANRTSVEETVRAFGMMRQMGVTDIGAQARAITNLGSAARVAGVSFGEMASTAFSAVTPGFASGLSMETSMGLAGDNLAAAREASRSGVLGGALVARAGGAGGIASAITGAQQRFLGTAAAKLAFQGGGGGGFMAQMSRGLGHSARSLDDALAFEASTMEDISPEQAGALHTGFIRQQLGFMGVTDFTSSRARNMAFQLTRGEMGDAGALAYSNMNFTAGGQASMQRQRFAQLADRERNAGLARYDEYYNANSAMSSFRRGVGALGSGLYQAADWASGLFSTGQAVGRYREDVAAMSLGAASGTMSMDAWAEYGSRKEAAMPVSGVLTGLGSRKAGGWAGGLLGVGVGAALGSMFLPFVGTAVGGFIGGAAGALGLGYLGGGIGGMLGAETTLTGSALAGYATTYAASQTAQADATRITDSMRGSASFRELTSNLNRADLGVDGSLGVQKLISQAAKEAGPGTTEEDIVAGFKGIGGSLGMNKAVETFGGQKGTALVEALLKGDMSKTGISAASAEFNMSARDYVKAYRKGDGKGQEAALASFQKMGLGSAQIQALRNNVANIALTGGSLKDTEDALTSGAQNALTANGRVAMEALRKDFQSTFASKKGMGGVANSVFEFLDKASPEEMRETLMGKGENREAILSLMKQAGGAYGEAADVATSSFDFMTHTATEAARKFQLGDKGAAKISQMKKDGRSSEAIRDAVFMVKAGATQEGETGETKADRARVQALEAIRNAMNEMATRLGAGKAVST